VLGLLPPLLSGRKKTPVLAPSHVLKPTQQMRMTLFVTADHRQVNFVLDIKFFYFLFFNLLIVNFLGFVLVF
jgi:hypothetical protein